MTMALTNAQKQARWRERRNALARANPEAAERELLQAAERSSRLPDRERIALADKLADAAMAHLRRSQELARLATKVRAGER
jgi:hypothetical protein